MNLEVNLSRSRLLAAAGGAELAHLAPFQLGPLVVEPAMLRLAGLDGEARVIQPLAMRVLLALAETPGETSSRDDLVAVCWNQRIVGDDSVHRIISTLRRDLGHLSAGAVAIETIPKVGYRLRVGAAQSIAEAAAVATKPTSKPFANRWPVVALLVAGLASAGMLAATRPETDIMAIAVIADTEAANGASARFADGLTGDLARLASAMPSLAFVEPGGHRVQEPLLLRVALDADAGLPTARVRLVDRQAGTVVWSREFAAAGRSLTELREVVANGVTGVLQCGLDRSAVFDDPVGLRLYLGACEGLETGDFERARTFAQQITEFRPNAPAGWACLANTTIFAAAKQGPVDDAVLARAESYARRALAVDQNSGFAYVALAMVSSWRGEPVLAILEQGIRTDPDFAMLHEHYAWALGAAGMASEAVDPALRAVALQPHDPDHHQLAVAALLNAGRIDEAAALTDKMQRMWRYDPEIAMQRLDMLFYARDAKTALASFSAQPRDDDPRVQAIHEALIWRIDPEGYDWSRFDRTAQEIAATDASLAWHLTLVAAKMGDRARALKWLERAPPTAFNAWSPLFGPQAAAVRRDPRFLDKMAEIGMVARWRKSGRWPDFCSEAGLGYDCRKDSATVTAS